MVPTEARTRRQLEALGLVKAYRGRCVVNKVDLRLREGEIVGLLGANGAGKTTSFYMIIGLIRPTEGRILLNDQDITGLPMYARARLGIGYLAQEPSVFRRLTVRQNFQAVLEHRKLPRSEQAARIGQLIAEFGLEGLEQSRADTLSGGERRRVEIARALATEPSFLLLDEPFSGIDPITVAEIQEIVLRLKQQGIGILITDHNVRETLKATDRSYIMHEGRILKHGPAQELVEDEMVRQHYLGHAFEF